MTIQTVRAKCKTALNVQRTSQFYIQTSRGKNLEFRNHNFINNINSDQGIYIKSPVSKVLPSISKSTNDKLILVQQCNCHGQQNVTLRAIWPYLSKEPSIKDITFEYIFSSSAAAEFLSMFSKQHPSFSNNKGVSEVAQC